MPECETRTNTGQFRKSQKNVRTACVKSLAERSVVITSGSAAL